jgi:hypothetical protein
MQSQSSAEEPGGAADGSRVGRWQFSLRGLMLFVLLAAMGMALFTTGWKLRRAEKELEEYSGPKKLDRDIESNSWQVASQEARKRA